MTISRCYGLLGLFLLLPACAIRPQPAAAMGKYLWVSRFEYSKAADIRNIMQDANRMGCSAVMFQVRGNGTVLFSSGEEIWSERFGFRKPGFDPLSQAVRSGHALGLEVHAWINLLPGWQGEAEPKDPRQLFNSRRDWFLQEQGGKTQAREGRYCWLNPALPPVRHYLADLCREIVKNYGVDGIHLDYVRYPDNPSLGLGMAQKNNHISQLLRQIRRGQIGLLRAPKLSVAVVADLAKARGRLGQDWPAWARAGLVDMVFPMNYTADLQLFRQRLRQCVAVAGRVPVIAGIGVYKHQEAGGSIDTTMAQLEEARLVGAKGVALFSYQSASKDGWQDALLRWGRR